MSTFTLIMIYPIIVLSLITVVAFLLILKLIRKSSS